MEQKPLKDLIFERLETKGYNLEKAIAATGVPKHYLEAILNGDWSKLPAAPYTKGYFKKLESLLELEPNYLWGLYQEETEVKSSGPDDKLPENRFAIKNVKRRWLWPAIITVLALFYLAFNANRLLGNPKLEIINPLSATAITALPEFTFVGEIDPNNKLFINQEEVYVDKSGQFQENYQLQPGLNTFEIISKKFLGRETKVVKQIIYQPNDSIIKK